MLGKGGLKWPDPSGGEGLASLASPFWQGAGGAGVEQSRGRSNSLV